MNSYSILTSNSVKHHRMGELKVIHVKTYHTKDISVLPVSSFFMTSFTEKGCDCLVKMWYKKMGMVFLVYCSLTAQLVYS